MFLNSSTKFKIFFFKADFCFQIKNFIDKKSQVGPSNHICLSLQYIDTLQAGRRAAAL